MEQLGCLISVFVVIAIIVIFSLGYVVATMGWMAGVIALLCILGLMSLLRFLLF